MIRQVLVISFLVVHLITDRCDKVIGLWLLSLNRLKNLFYSVDGGSVGVSTLRRADTAEFNLQCFIFLLQLTI